MQDAKCKYFLAALVQHDQKKEARQALLTSKGLNKRPSESLPTRAEQLKSLATEQFDVLVIGGGATGISSYVNSLNNSNVLRTMNMNLNLMLNYYCLT